MKTRGSPLVDGFLGSSSLGLSLLFGNHLFLISFLLPFPDILILLLDSFDVPRVCEAYLELNTAHALSHVFLDSIWLLVATEHVIYHLFDFIAYFPVVGVVFQVFLEDVVLRLPVGLLNLHVFDLVFILLFQRVDILFVLVN